MVGKFVELCPIKGCAFETEDDGDHPVMDKHIAEAHPEVLEPDPVRVGRLYRKALHRKYRRV